MKRLCTIGLCLLLLSAMTMAQTETDGQLTPPSNVDIPPIDVNSHLSIDSIPFHINPLGPQLPKQESPKLMDFTKLTKQGATGLNLWKGASLGFYGMTDQMPGLMNIETGRMTLYQQAGRWHFTVSALANKYWMPWQHTLSTQYGYGGTIGYDLSETVSLHAFGYYYANQLQVGPAMSPFVNNSTYGGYADIRFNKTFGANVGVRRYVNPWNGKWVTEPIVNPYIKIGDSKIELPLGGLLKALVWGDRDNPRNFRPRPQPQTPTQPLRRIRR